MVSLKPTALTLLPLLALAACGRERPNTAPDGASSDPRTQPDAQAIPILEPDPAAAREHFSKARQLLSKSDIQLGSRAFHVPSLQAALGEFRMAIARDPGNAEYHYGAGTAQWMLKDFDAALEALERAVELEPAHVHAWSRMGTIHLARGENEKAQHAIETALALDDSIPELLVDAGTLADERGDLEQARRYYERAVEVGPTHPGPHFRLSSLLRRFEGEQAAADREMEVFEHWQTVRDALIEVERAAEADPENSDLATDMGVILHSLQKPERAKEELERALTLNPSDARAHLVLGKLLAEAGEGQQAIQHLDLALEHDPMQAEAWGERARLDLEQGQIDQAIERLEQSFEQVGEDPDNLFLLALVQRDGKQWESAVATLERVIAARPEHIGARLVLGEVLVQLDRRSQAEQQYEEVLRIDAGNEAATQSLAWLRAEGKGK